MNRLLQFVLLLATGHAALVAWVLVCIIMNRPLKVPWRFVPALLLATVYAVLVAWLALCVIPARKVRTGLTYRVAHNLPSNARLRNGDLVEPRLPLGYFWYLPPEAEFIGKYLSKCPPRAKGDPCLYKGDPIGLDDLSVWPDLSPREGEENFLIALRNRPQLADVITVGCVLGLYGSNAKKSHWQATVKAIVCAGKDQADCYAVVPLAKRDAEELSEEKEASLRVTLLRYP